MGAYIKSVLATSLLLSVSVSNVASAADISSCSCFLPAQSGTIGTVVSASGDVFKSGAVGFRKAAAGSDLKVSSQVSTGDDGQASLSYGSGCTLSVGPNQLVSVAPDGGQLCVVQTAAAVAPVGTNYVGPAVVGLGVIGVGVALATNKKSNGGGAPASP